MSRALDRFRQFLFPGYAPREGINTDWWSGRQSILPEEALKNAANLIDSNRQLKRLKPLRKKAFRLLVSVY